MKKLIAVLLTLVMVLGIAVTAANAEEAAPVKKLYIVNNYADDMEPVYDDNQTRYNAYWLDSYSVSKYAADNFWFTPADDTVVSVVSFEDLYDYNAGIETPMTWGVFKDQYFCLNVPEAIKSNYPTGTVCGAGFDKNYLPYNQGFIICGPEAIVFPTTDEEGYTAQYLFEDIGMVEADAYDFHCGDGYVHHVDAEDLIDEFIYVDDSGRVHANCIEYPDYPLMDIQFIVPEDTDASAAPAAEGVTKINFANNGTGILDAEASKAANVVVLVEGATVKAPLGGSTQEGYRIADLLAKLEIPACETVTAISYIDGATLDQSYEAFAQKYLVLADSKDRAPYTVGTVQEYNDVLKNTGCYVLGDSVLVCVAPSFTQEAGYCVADIVAALGLEGITSAKVVCSDGYAEEVDAEDFADLFLFHIESRVDSSSIAYPEYTLTDACVIELY